MRLKPKFFFSFFFAVIISIGSNAQGIDSNATNWSMPGIDIPKNISISFTYDPATGFYIGQKYIGETPIGLSLIHI